MVRRVLVTGGNKGLGFEACKELLKIPDMHILLGSRDIARGEEAIKVLSEGGNEGRVELCHIDCENPESIKKAAEAYGAKYGPKSLYCVVNNAGLGSRYPYTVVWAVNAIGPILVTDAFLPYMVEDGRVVTVGSLAGVFFFPKLSEAWQAKILNPERADLDWMNKFVMETEEMELFEKEGLGDWVSDKNSYSLSKLVVCAHAALLAKQYPKMKCNAIEPGVVDTDMTKPMFEKMGPHPFEKMGFPTTQVEDGVKVYIHAIVGEVGNGFLYSGDCKRSHFGRVRKYGDPEYSGED